MILLLPTAEAINETLIWTSWIQIMRRLTFPQGSFDSADSNGGTSILIPEEKSAEMDRHLREHANSWAGLEPRTFLMTVVSAVSFLSCSVHYAQIRVQVISYSQYLPLDMQSKWRKFSLCIYVLATHTHTLSQRPKSAQSHHTLILLPFISWLALVEQHGSVQKLPDPLRPCSHTSAASESEEILFQSINEGPSQHSTARRGQLGLEKWHVEAQRRCEDELRVVTHTQLKVSGFPTQVLWTFRSDFSLSGRMVG